MKNLIFIVLLLSLSVSFSQDGTPDLSFGDNGIKLIDLNADENYIVDFDQNEDGKIYSVGAVSNYNQQQIDGRFIMVNLSDGTLDSSFGNNGILFTEGTFIGYSHIKLLKDGKILVSGHVDLESSISRLFPDGSLDTTFGNNGYIYYPSQTIYRNILFDGDNSFFLIGVDTSENPEIIVQKFFTDGSSDSDYGNNGIAIISLGDVESLRFSATISPTDESLFFTTKYTDVATTNQIYKLAPNGNLDVTFGNSGKALIPVDEAFACSSLVFNNQSVLVSCHYWDQNSEEYIKKSLKLNSGGNLNQNFGEEGYLNGAYGSFIQENQRIINDNTGFNWEGGAYLHLERFFGNGEFDNSFQFDSNFFGEVGHYIIKPLKNGKILCAANTIWYDPPPNYLILQQFNNNPLGISDFEANYITVSPNPSSSAFVIHSKFPFEKEYFQVLDITGKHIKEGFLYGEKPTIDLSHFDTGIYFLKFENSTFKLLKN